MTPIQKVLSDAPIRLDDCSSEMIIAWHPDVKSDVTARESLGFFNATLLNDLLIAVREELKDMSYVGVLDSNEKRRGYDIAWQEFAEMLNKHIQ